MRYSFITLLAAANTVQGLTLTIDYEHISEDGDILSTFFQTVSWPQTKVIGLKGQYNQLAAGYSVGGSSLDASQATTVTDVDATANFVNLDAAVFTFLSPEQERFSSVSNKLTLSSSSTLTDQNTESSAVSSTSASSDSTSSSVSTTSSASSQTSQSSGTSASSSSSSSQESSLKSSSSESSSLQSTSSTPASRSSGAAQVIGLSSTFLFSMGAIFALV